MNVMMIPLPQSLLRQINEAVATSEEVEEAKTALQLTNGNVPQAAGLLRQTMSLPKMYAALRVVLGK